MLLTRANQKKLEETSLVPVAVEKNTKNAVENLCKNNHQQVFICKDALESNQGIKSLKTCIILPEITPVDLSDSYHLVKYTVSLN